MPHPPETSKYTAITLTRRPPPPEIWRSFVKRYISVFHNLWASGGLNENILFFFFKNSVVLEAVAKANQQCNSFWHKN